MVNEKRIIKATKMICFFNTEVCFVDTMFKDTCNSERFSTIPGEFAIILLSCLNSQLIKSYTNYKWAPKDTVYDFGEKNAFNLFV